MAWIELHQSLRDHRKMFACAEMLNLSRKEMIGTLVSLWLWALDNAQDGGLDGVSNRTIASVCDWPEKKADKLVEALRSTGWIDTDPDGRLVIHDWSDYAGKLMERREKDRERKRKPNNKPAETERNSTGIPADIRGNSCATVPIPYLNRTNTISTHNSVNPDAGTAEGTCVIAEGRSFTLFWEDYPKKSKRDEAWEAWKQLNPDATTVAAIRQGLSAWKQSGQWAEEFPRYVPPAVTWLTGRQWEWAPAPAKGDIPKGASGELGAAELEAIQRVLGDDPGGAK